ncbi:hypothetical protein [Deinococcus sp. 14RED07]|nr:hypothetical protein [Deinococcus sp. 14RED07]
MSDLEVAMKERRGDPDRRVVTPTDAGRGADCQTEGRPESGDGG